MKSFVDYVTESSKVEDFALKTLPTFLKSKNIINDLNDDYDIEKQKLLFEVKPKDSEKTYIVEFDIKAKKFVKVSEF